MGKWGMANERRTRIVDATIFCINGLGYHNLSMQDIAERARVSKGVIHYYFLNKDELMLAVLDRVVGDIENAFLGCTVQGPDPKQSLSLAVRAFMEIVKEKREYYRVNLDFWAQTNQRQDIKQILAGHYEKFRRALALIVDRGISEGVFRPGNPSYYASFVIAAVEGVALQWFFDESAFDYAEMQANLETLIGNALMAENRDMGTDRHSSYAVKGPNLRLAKALSLSSPAPSL